MVPILFAYGGWQNANYLAEEIERPRAEPAAQPHGRHVAVVLIYVLVNIVYLRALGLEGLAATTTPASRAAGDDVRGSGIGSSPRRSRSRRSGSSIWRSSRRRGSTTRWRRTACSCRRWRACTRVSIAVGGIVLQSTWSCVLALTGRYEQLLNYVVFADWIFFGLTVGTVLVFRRRLPLSERPAHAFRCPGYPV